MGKGSRYIHNPYVYYVEKYGMVPGAMETIKKAIATAKRLYGVA